MRLGTAPVGAAPGTLLLASVGHLPLAATYRRRCPREEQLFFGDFVLWRVVGLSGPPQAT